MSIAPTESTTLSFANNFWGKDDAGVGPLFQRMHDAKTTCDELRTFYTARAAIEEEFAKKLLALAKKPLGSSETGTLKASMDILRLEVEGMGKAHQSIASQMKTELEEPLTAFSSTMRERRKIVQGGCEKILKLKMQQTQQVNKTRDRYEQDCLKIKGYLAQGHMVMGQEERKNKARLEKTQTALAGSNAEYEAAIKALEETTTRWNRDWKAACDKFQDLEEERIDFLKVGLWSFANISSTVCVHDDESCEKVRISLEDCEVEKDITSFILDRGTGQDIPDAPKYINFSRGDVSDDDISETGGGDYSVAQFPRAGNPAYRSSSPNPSMTSSSQSGSTPPSEVMSRIQSKSTPELQAQSQSARSRDRQRREHERRESERQELERKDIERRELEHREHSRRNSRDQRLRSAEPLTPPANREILQNATPSSRSRRDTQYALSSSTTSRSQQYERENTQRQSTPHNEYPLDGMTMHCRPGALVSDAASSSGSPVARPPSSHASGSDYSNPTSVSSLGDVVPPPSIGGDRRGSPTKQQQQISKDDPTQKRRSGFFSSGGPFRRKSKSEKESNRQMQLQQQQVQQQQAQQQVQQHTQQQAQQQQAQQQQAQQQAQQQQQVTQQRRIEAQRQQELAQSRPTGSASARSNRNTWAPGTITKNTIAPQSGQSRGGYESGSSNRRQQELLIGNDRHESPEPIDPRASLALNVGGNVFDVSTPAIKDRSLQKPQEEEEEVPDLDPIAQALAELKGVTKGSTGSRNTADRYFGLATPTPGTAPTPNSNPGTASSQRGTPLPGYAPPKSSALGLPPPAFTSAQMIESTKRYVNQRDQMLDGPPQMPAAAAENSLRGNPGRQRANTMDYAGNRAQSRQSSHDMPRNRQENNRSVSPVPTNRSVSPRPQLYGDQRYRNTSPQPQPMNSYSRGNSPNPYTQSRPGTANSKGQYTAYSHRSMSPMPSGQEVALNGFRNHSPAPSHHSRNDSYGSRGRNAESVRGGYEGNTSRQSYYEGSQGGSQIGTVSAYQGQVARPRSKSVVDTSRKYTREGRLVLHYARAIYPYQATIDVELSFAKGDILAILNEQEDGWWESEIVGVQGRTGLVPSNYLQNC